MVTSLPATIVEAEALSYTRAWAARADAGDFLGLGCSILDPECGPRFLRRLMRTCWENSARAQLLLIELARAGWDEADDLLRELILEFINRGEPLPAFLATYNAWVVTGSRTAPRPRGRKKSTNVMQDVAVVVLVVELVECFNLRPTRNAVSSRPSACSVAARVVRPMGEEAVNKVWRKYGPIITRGMRGWREGRFLGRR
jgi:hypothetical protein